MERKNGYEKKWVEKMASRSMEKAVLIRQLDAITACLTIPDTVVPEEERWDEDEVYYFFRSTEQVFEDLIDDVVNEGRPRYMPKTKHELHDRPLHTLFQEIRRPTVLFESYHLQTDLPGRERERETMVQAFLCMWDHGDGDNRVFYWSYFMHCEYHIVRNGRLWIQPLDRMLEACGGTHDAQGFHLTMDGIHAMLRQI